MVFLTISKKVTGFIGPFLMRTGLSARKVLLRNRPQDSPYLDLVLLVRYAQKIISLHVHDESARVVTQFKDKSKLDKMVDTAYDSIFGKAAEEERKEKASISELRVEVLEDNVRPALIPNNEWSDVSKWRFNFRVIQWARTEFLVSKYGPQVKEALDAYPQLRASPQLSRHPTERLLLNLIRGKTIDLSSKKKLALPSSETLIKAFNMRHWAKRKDTQSVRRSMVPIATKLGGRVLESSSTASDGSPLLLSYAEIPTNADLINTTLEEVLELTGGHVVHCGPFNAVCEEAGMYQMWTEDYVTHLGRYLLDRASQFAGGDEDDSETIIVDVGAGDGLLVQFLNEFMDLETTRLAKKPGSKRLEPQKPPTIVATDDGSWGIFAKAQVEKLNMRDAIMKYSSKKDDGKKKRQLIVLCSWMPMGEDWTAFFREQGVDEYILIGEADDGTCGDNWETWGNEAFLALDEDLEASAEASDDASVSKAGKVVPLYKEDGYERWDMDALAQFQFSRFDCAVSRSSKTVSFRKRRR